MRILKLIAIVVPLALLILVGLTAGALSDVFGWVDGQCREWFDNIYGRQP